MTNDIVRARLEMLNAEQLEIIKESLLEWLMATGEDDIADLINFLYEED